ncbi:sigma-70 family RNA polymerase sigma factor [Sutcliffiella horikoshii]|uniref:sigma-70 family RNA polymerase sigma factor n=1 Tax=Sutcliffiella horikoshii TaxID=79883 RepID=UPI00203F29A1|nr:sigma-70 family RNA polymerase sigma factor [Sutcliffiella horikoshii]MCM3619326.1 sigma-70 family RNA polymerase sigma factor [Sutcliffiella horikoshii]
MKQSIDDLYEEHMQDIFRYLLSLCREHHLAEDLVQETFLRAYLYLENYRGEDVKPWLFRIAHNAFIDHYRKHKRTVVKEQGFFQRLFGKGHGTEQEVLLKTEVAEVMEVINTLSEQQAQAILLYDYHSFTYKEAADAIGVTDTYFKVLLYRARQKVRSIQGKENENNE